MAHFTLMIFSYEGLISRVTALEFRETTFSNLALCTAF